MNPFLRHDEQTEAAFLARARQLVVLCDVEGRDRMQRLLDAATERQIPVSLFVIEGNGTGTATRDEMERVGAYLQEQRMGTRVAVAVSATLLVSVEPALAAVGLTREEVRLEPQAARRAPVFCAACYFHNPPSAQRYIRCAQCQRVLEVSEHYSPRLHAVMGHVSLKEQRVWQPESDVATGDAEIRSAD